MSKTYIFISDAFKEDVMGGGEIANEEIIISLQERGFNVIKRHSSFVDLFFLEKHKGARFIIGNFIHLSDSTKRALGKEKYIIYEHDHKYLKTRDPSCFKDFTAPRQQLVNVAFYRGACSVICQSRLHTSVIERNLGLKNVKNAGGNPWSTSELDFIEEICDRPKNPVYGIMNSQNGIKNTEGAINYCAENGINYKLLGPASPRQFLEQVSECEGFVFFPKVLETLSRIVIEARMLNCKILTNDLIGAASEDWFSLKGRPLIKHMREKREEIVDLFVDTFKQKSPHEDVIVILNSYRRPHNLQMQIQAIRNQTCPPKEIWLWVNEHEDSYKFDFEKLDIDKIFHNDHNWKFYGRFSAALLADTTYVAIFDDDTIPGTRWFENCLDTMEQQEGIMGSAGVILEGDTYNPHKRCGWPTNNEKAKRVDLVGHAWFFKRKWLKYLWLETPPTWDNGEDIQFSYLAQKYGGINTYCPPHPPDNKDMHGSIRGNELGIDDKATSTNTALSHQVFFSERDYCVQNALKNGWVPVSVGK
tara:strand:+ start:1159 stop:2751 length:1593 start_codon:yes stop_codon:yes gene_type:complete